MLSKVHLSVPINSGLSSVAAFPVERVVERLLSAGLVALHKFLPPPNKSPLPDAELIIST